MRKKWCFALIRNHWVCSLDQFDDTDTRRIMKCREPDIFRAVQTKMDYQTWYHRQSTRDQQIIDDLAMSHTTNEVAKKFGVTPGAVSQYRKRFATSWHNFIDPPEESGAIVVA